MTQVLRRLLRHRKATAGLNSFLRQGIIGVTQVVKRQPFSTDGHGFEPHCGFGQCLNSEFLISDVMQTDSRKYHVIDLVKYT